LLGKLYVGVIKGGETYSFEFEREWLKKTAH
jgi:serine/threonine-protein kinase HipA